MFVVVEIFANLGLKDTIGHAEHTLTVAQAAAGTVATNDGSLDDADHLRLAAVEPSLQWIPGAEQSTGLDQVSVATANGGLGSGGPSTPRRVLLPPPDRRRRDVLRRRHLLHRPGRIAGHRPSLVAANGVTRLTDIQVSAV